MEQPLSHSKLPFELLINNVSLLQHKVTLPSKLS